jgi:hypothetical protein
MYQHKRTENKNLKDTVWVGILKIQIPEIGERPLH